MPYKNKEDLEKNKREYHVKNRKKRSIYMQKWYAIKRKDPSFLEKENDLHREYNYRRKLVQRGGLCWICGEIDARVLISHHVLGDGKVSGRALSDDNIAGICANCHMKYKGYNKDVHVKTILKAIENGVLFK